MEQIRWKVPKVIDAHVHYRHRRPPVYFNQILDLVNSLHLAHAKAEMLRLFLETDQTFTSLRDKAYGIPPQPWSNGRTELHGLSLPVEVLQKVLCGNFQAFAGASPKVPV